MEFQTLKKDNRKYWVIGISVMLILAVVLCFVGTRAKYRNTQNIQVATGNIDYVKDTEMPVITKVESSNTKNSITLTVTATDNVGVTKYYYSNDGGNAYTESTSNYYTFSDLSAESYNIAIYVTDAANNKSTTYTAKVLIVPAADTILANNSGATAIEAKTAPNFANTSCTAGTNNDSDCGEATNGMYASADDDGTSYYFRGSVDNNWVSFANFYWRIIRINGDGTIRLIYNGTSAGATGTSTQISTSEYYTGYDNNMYVGYMYTDGEVHGTGTDSTIKSAVDSWYLRNLLSYASYIDTNAGFCNDRYPSTSSSSSNGSGGTSTTKTYYAAYIRLFKNKTPSLKCTESTDLFTVKGAKKTDGTTTKGNGALTYPVGLITADEIAYAGAVYNTNNYGYWLYTGQDYWTMSPYWFSSSFAVKYPGVFYVDSAGLLSFDKVEYAYGVRPVINLKADTIFSSGNGTSSSPYVVQTS